MAICKVVPKEDWEVLKKYVNAGEFNAGVVLIPEEIYEKEKEKKYGIEKYIENNNYDFGGDADVWVDVVLSEEHCFLSGISNLTSEENDEKE